MSTKKRILFVDDEAAILSGLETLLRKQQAQWDVVYAASGEDGLAEARKAPFDVVVSDLRLPGIDGATFLELIKEESPATLRILFSGYSDDESLGRALSSIHYRLNKPCDLATLRGSLERLAGAGG